MTLTPLIKVKGVSTRLEEAFKRLKIFSTYDLILNLPNKYDNYEISSLYDAVDGQTVTLRAKINSEVTNIRLAKLNITNLKCLVDDLELSVTVFNQPYLYRSLKEGDRVLIKGKLDFLRLKFIASTISKKLDQPDLVAKYGVKEIKDFQIRKLVDNIFRQNQVTIYETLPQSLIKQHQLLSRDVAIKTLHQPPNQAKLELALYRFKYEEAFFEQLRFAFEVSKRKRRAPINYQIELIKDWIEKIPYPLTSDQKKVVNQIFLDYKKSQVSYRLIQGDVGSGKTIVSFLAALGMISAKKQVAIMAPTAMLALQHYQNFTALYPAINSELLTTQTKDKGGLKARLVTGETQIVFGTQALLVDDVSFNELGLIIIDEQHKFGVNTRETLLRKGEIVDCLYLTATPIPRSMALAYLGSTDYSIIKEKPANRKEVKTKIVSNQRIDELIEIIKQTSKSNQQVYIVVPAINAATKTYTIETTLALIKDKIPNENLYVLHSKLPNQDKETLLNSFLTNQAGILLATTMVEVGIDAPNATLMIILDAHHFGLAQLHQLRGRVGRGGLSSSAYLVTSKTEIERLEILTKTNDGFELSKFDLKTRGAGNLLTHQQSGFKQYKHLNLVTDLQIINQARVDAQAISNQIDNYPNLINQLKKNKI